MRMFRLIFIVVSVALFGGVASAQVALTGVNLAGADFGEDTLPGRFGVQYTYPTAAELDYFTAKGMNVFRLPFRWERLQRGLNSAFDADELARIRAFVDGATGTGAKVILDPHNYARYHGQVIGDGVPVAAFADFWGRLAVEFGGNRNVIFSLMNEPNDMATELWLEGANGAIAAIRGAGAGNLILVPGNGWSGAHSWGLDYYGTPNGQVMTGLRDPIGNFAYDVHQYLDGDSSGSSADCVSRKVGVERLRAMTAWLHRQGARAFLSEFGGGRNETCLAAVDNMLGYMDANADVWMGWTWWAAGPWWGDYIFTLEPENGVDRAQMAILERHMAR